jgi:hypothetical protein
MYSSCSRAIKLGSSGMHERASRGLLEPGSASQSCRSSSAASLSRCLAMPLYTAAGIRAAQAAHHVICCPSRNPVPSQGKVTMSSLGICPQPLHNLRNVGAQCRVQLCALVEDVGGNRWAVLGQHHQRRAPAVVGAAAGAGRELRHKGSMASA